jgi:hypothetical protein
VRTAVAAFDLLVKAGFAPFCPHLSHYAEEVHNVRLSHQTWIEVDVEWVESSEAVYRLRGASKGADMEVEHAEKCGVPVFHTLSSLESWRDNEWVRREPKPLNRRFGDPRFHDRLQAMGELHDRKQADYGTDGDPFANVRASKEFGIPPWLGAILRLNDKVTRIKSFAKKGSLKNEPLQDSFDDIAVYAVIARILYDEEHGGT